MSNIFKKIPLIMAEIGSVGKDGYNQHQKYKFRGIEQFYNAAHPALVNNGVFCVPQVIDSKSENYEKDDGKISFRVLLKVNHKFYADDGSFVEVITQGEGIDTSDKASNKAMSAAMKYALIELFCIPTEDVADSDKDHPEVSTQKPVAQKPKVVIPMPRAVAAAPAPAEEPVPAWVNENEPEVSAPAYVIPFGQFKGKTFNECDINEVQKYARWIQEAAEKENKPLKPVTIKFLNELANYLTYA